jgi:cell division protein FtsX
LLTKDDARREFERIFADDPDLVERVDTESLPQSVRIRMRSGQSVDALRERFAGAPGVDEVVEFKPFGGLFADRDVTIPPHGLDGLAVDVEIFLDLEATDDEARAVESALAKDAAVASVDEVTKPEAFEEFREVFAGQPSLVENVDPDGFPASFRVTLVDSADAAAFEARYRQLPGVDEVVSPDVSVGCFGFPTR